MWELHELSVSSSCLGVAATSFDLFFGPLQQKGAAQGLSSALTYRRDHAELLQDAQSVAETPLLDELAVNDPPNADFRDCYALVGRLDA